MDKSYETIWDYQGYYFPHEGGDYMCYMPEEESQMQETRKSKLVVAVAD